jgi:hypothetical protein
MRVNTAVDVRIPMSLDISATTPDKGRRNPRPCAGFVSPYSRTPRSRSAFEITVTELRLMAAAAIIGDSSQPSHG